jgi:ABC-type Fe3+/spermidine/putrescine transport system ATPase subunit
MMFPVCTVTYGAVDGVTIGIRDGEFFSMLGPSGSGKTTCLRDRGV